MKKVGPITYKSPLWGRRKPFIEYVEQKNSRVKHGWYLWILRNYREISWRGHHSTWKWKACTQRESQEVSSIIAMMMLWEIWKRWLSIKCSFNLLPGPTNQFTINHHQREGPYKEKKTVPLISIIHGFEWETKGVKPVFQILSNEWISFWIVYRFDEPAQQHLPEEKTDELFDKYTFKSCASMQHNFKRRGSNAALKH